MNARRLTTFCAVAAFWTCSDVFGPERRIKLTLEVVPADVALGDTVQLLGIAHNGTKRTVNPGLSCTPGIGRRVVILHAGAIVRVAEDVGELVDVDLLYIRIQLDEERDIAGLGTTNDDLPLAHRRYLAPSS